MFGIFEPIALSLVIGVSCADTACPVVDVDEVGKASFVYFFEDDDMATAYEEISSSLGVLADNVGDLWEEKAANDADIAALQSQFNNINIEDVIDDAAPTTATNVTRSASFINTLFEQAKSQLRDGVDTAYDTLAKVANALTALGSRVDQLELDVAELKSKFDADGNLKLDHIPASIRNGDVDFLGFFDVQTSTLAAASPDNDGDFWKIQVGGSITLNPGTANERTVSAIEGDTLMSDGTQWVKLGRKDVITSVNGKTGDVVLVAADMTYTASNESGLTATTVKAGLDELGAKIKAKFAEIGDFSQLMTAAQLANRINTARTDGVATA